MESLWVWVTIAGLTLATLLTRAGFLVLGERVSLPTWLERALRYAPACALVAIVVPELVYTHGRFDLSLENYRLIAAVVATMVFIHVRNLLWTIVLGMTVFTALRLLAA